MTGSGVGKMTRQRRTGKGGWKVEEVHYDFVVAVLEVANQEKVEEMRSGTRSELRRKPGEERKRLFSDLGSLDLNQRQSLMQPEDPTHSDLGRNAAGLFQ
jgi:hypothetical protein